MPVTDASSRSPSRTYTYVSKWRLHIPGLRHVCVIDSIASSSPSYHYRRICPSHFSCHSTFSFSIVSYHLSRFCYKTCVMLCCVNLNTLIITFQRRFFCCYRLFTIIYYLLVHYVRHISIWCHKLWTTYHTDTNVIQWEILLGSQEPFLVQWRLSSNVNFPALQSFIHHIIDWQGKRCYMPQSPIWKTWCFHCADCVRNELSAFATKWM